MRRNKRVCRGPSGFTLLEVLLAVMIVAMMGGSLFATFAAGFKLDQRIRQSFADLDESRIVTEYLRRDFGRAINYDFRGSYKEQKSFFDNEDGLMFVIDDGQQLRWVRYRVGLEKNDEVRSTEIGATTKKNIAVSNTTSTEKTLQALIREEGDFVQLLSTSPSRVPDKTEVLTKRIADKGWETSFALAVTPQAKVEWRNEWKEDFLPGAVRVSLPLQNSKGQVRMTVSDFLLPAGGRSEI